MLKQFVMEWLKQIYTLILLALYFSLSVLVLIGLGYLIYETPYWLSMTVIFLIITIIMTIFKLGK